MKCAIFALLFSMTAFAQDAGWVRSQWNDKLTGNLVVAYQLFPKPDESGRKPYIGITCDQVGKRFTYGYFTDEMISINAPVALYSGYDPSNHYATVMYRVDSTKPKRDLVSVRSDFRTIDLDQQIMIGLSGGREFAISYPSLRGYEVTDVFESSPLPPSYGEDCYTEKMRQERK